MREPPFLDSFSLSHCTREGEAIPYHNPYWTIRHSLTNRSLSKSRSAEGAALCRGVGCPHFSLFLMRGEKAGVQRAQPFAGVWGVPTFTLFLGGWVGNSESFD